MEGETASRLFHEGGFLILLEVPQGTEIGIDYNSWNVGPKFKGIKMIPPGLHMIYYSSVGKDRRETGPRCSFFHFFKPKEILVRVWNPRDEELTEETVDQSLIDRLREKSLSSFLLLPVVIVFIKTLLCLLQLLHFVDLYEMDSSLGPYPYEHLKKWLALTNYITPSLVKRIIPQHASSVNSITKLNEQMQATPPTSLAPPTSEAPPTSTCSGYFAGVGEFSDTIGGGGGGKTKQEGAADVECTCLRFSVIPKFNYPPGATPTEISHHSLDLSYTLEQLMLGYDGKVEEQEDHALGELQLSFVYFLIGQVYDGFEQWKRLVRVLCLSDSALSLRPSLFINFMTVLHFQLKEVPEQFFVDIISSNNFLTGTLQVFFTNLQEGDSLNHTLKEKAAMFKTSLSKKFDFTTELEEDMPTIVEEHNT